MIPVPHIFFSLSRKEARLSERRGIWNAMMQLVRSGWSGDGRRWTWTQTHTRRQQITSLLLSCYCPSGPSHAAQQETQKVQRMHVQSPSKRLLLGSVYSPLPGSGITQPRINLFERTRSEIRGSLGARSNLKGMKITDLPSRSWASFLQLPLHCMKSLEEMAAVAVTGQEKGRGGGGAPRTARTITLGISSDAISQFVAYAARDDS